MLVDSKEEKHRGGDDEVAKGKERDQDEFAPG
jgi:hypothetical protein